MRLWASSAGACKGFPAVCRNTSRRLVEVVNLGLERRDLADAAATETVRDEAKSTRKGDSHEAGSISHRCPESVLWH